MLKDFSISLRLLVITGLLLGLACSDDNPLGPSVPLPEAIGWVEQESPAEGRLLTAVDFVDEGRGWAVGENGVILSTRNGGANWYEQQSGTDNTLRDVDFVDRRNGWAVGHNGTILYTNDGGRKWVAQNSGTSSRLEEVTFLDSQTGWIAGRSMFVFLRTTDGGQHWIQDSIPDFRMLSNLSFVDEKNGLAILDLGKVVSSNDGGLSWTVLSETPRRYIWGMSFLNEEYGLIASTRYEIFEGNVGWHDRVYKTLDGGQNWSLIYIKRGGTMFGGKVIIKDRTSIFVAGGPYIQHSSDAGLSWTRQYENYSIELWDAVFISSDVGWAVGKDGTILHTTNGGVTPPTVLN